MLPSPPHSQTYEDTPLIKFVGFIYIGMIFMGMNVKKMSFLMDLKLKEHLTGLDLLRGDLSGFYSIQYSFMISIYKVKMIIIKLFIKNNLVNFNSII